MNEHILRKHFQVMKVILNENSCIKYNMADYNFKLNT